MDIEVVEFVKNLRLIRIPDRTFMGRKIYIEATGSPRDNWVAESFLAYLRDQRGMGPPRC